VALCSNTRSHDEGYLVFDRAIVAAVGREESAVGKLASMCFYVAIQGSRPYYSLNTHVRRKATYGVRGA
jgi:hypothetical protein